MFWHIQTTFHALIVLFGVSLGYMESGLIKFVKFGPAVLAFSAVIFSIFS